MPDIKQFILDYIQSEYTLPPDTDTDALNYVETGYVDSIGMIRFIAELEDAFGIAFSDEELTAPSFKTVGGLADRIKQKTEQAK